MHPSFFRCFGVWIFLSSLLCHLVDCTPAEPDDLEDDDTALGGVSNSVMEPSYKHPWDDQAGDDTLRGCECWKWPECVSNCTVNPILKEQMRVDYLVLERLPRPFVLVFPYQDRKSRSKYGTSTTGKRGTHYMNTKFWIHLPNREHVQLKLQKSTIFGGSNDYSTLYYRRDNEGQLYGFESSKFDHCFYTGTVRHDSNQFEPDTYVAVDTCRGLRGLIQTGNTTYGVLPLRCFPCQHDRLPHVVFPHQPSSIDQEAQLPFFWQPFDVLATKSHGLKRKGEPQYTVRLIVILDKSLAVMENRQLPTTLHLGTYGDSIKHNPSQLLTLCSPQSYQGLPIELRLIRSEIWNNENHIHMNTSIKITLNNFAVYTANRVQMDGPLRPSVPSNSTSSESRRPNRAWSHRRSRRAAAKIPEPASLNVRSVSAPRINRIGPQDVELLLTATQFTDVVEYLAVPDSICTPRALGVIQVNTSETLYHVSRLVSLAVSEMLGIKSFPCPPLLSCSSPDLFSEGDRARIRLALVSSMADCLIPTTPQPICPADLHLENGSPCRAIGATIQPTRLSQLMNRSELDDAQALCYQGRCPTRDSQCESVWGSGAVRAADYCFMFHNTKTAGACGVSGENCRPQHAMCGLLHCQGGKPRPVFPDAGQPFLTYTEHNGQQYECKHLSYTSKVRFVPEGASCGPNQHCFHQQCVPPNVALRSRCPSGPVNKYTEDGQISVRNVTCSDRGICTNGGFCLCRIGWSGNACQVEASTDSSMLLAAAATDRVSSINRNILANPTLLPPDPDIAKRIWTQMDAMRRPDHKSGSQHDSEDNPKTKLNTLYLVIILASVVGGTFLVLFIFMVIYRRRGQAGFPRKRTRSGCLPLTGSSKRLDQHTSPYNAKGNGSLRLYETSADGHGFQLALSPIRSRGTRSATEDNGFDYQNSSYLARWSHDRRSRRHGARRASREPDYPDFSDHHRGHRRRRRKHCRLDRHSGDDMEHSGRSSGRRTKYSDGSLSTSRRLLDAHVANHSDTELACRQAQDFEDETNSMDRIIKFGSMPSYKEDKLKQKKRHGERSTDAGTDNRNPGGDASSGTKYVPPQSPPPSQPNGQTVTMVSIATECIPSNVTVPDRSNSGGNNADSMLVLKMSPSRNPGLGSPLSPTSRTAMLNSPPTSAAPPPLFPHTSEADVLSPLASGGLAVVGEHGQSSGASKSLNTSPQADLSQALGATAALIGAGKAGAAAAIAVASGTVSTPGGKSSHASQEATDYTAQGKATPISEGLNSTDDMNDVHFSIVMENSWRQPEKGILKNKNEGGGLTSNIPSASVHKSTSRKSSSGRRHHRHRSSRHRHRRHKGSRSGALRGCDEVYPDCCSLDSECSCCLAEEDEKRASRDRPGSVQTEESKCSSSRSKCGHTRRHSFLGSETSLRSHNSLGSARERNASASSSGSSRSGLSPSSQSSSSSSFTDLDRANRDGVGDNMLLSSSSSSSTCSTALEVGPGGRIGRSTFASGNERPGGMARGDSESGVTEREAHRCSAQHNRDGCHRRRHHHRHRNRSRHHYGHGHKQHCYGLENAMSAGSASALGTTTSMDQGVTPGPESSGSSLSRTTTAGLSCGSSSSSGLLTPGSTHMHRRHRLVRNRRSTDDDATTSGSHQSSPIPPAPTILCNAGQQTDEISLLKAAGLTISVNKKDGKSPSTRPGESDGEWEEVECSESACEECQATSLANVAATILGNTTSSSAAPTNAPQITNSIGHHSSAKPFDSTDQSQLVGITNAAYIPSLRSSGVDANMSNTSIAYQQQSTASSSLGSSKNSRIGTPAPTIPNSQTPFLTGTQSPHGSALGVGNVKSGITNRAASSSSCSSSSVAGHNQALPKSILPSSKSGPDEFPNQHSEPEVDAHLHLAPVSRIGPFYSGLGVGPAGLVVNTGITMMTPTSTTSYTVGPTPSHFLLPPPPPSLPPQPPLPPVHPGSVRRDPYPSRFPGSFFTEDSLGLTNQTNRQPTRPMPTGHGPMGFSVTNDPNDTYYQHPYEEVATDDYAEANNHHLHTDSVYPNNHIYHQHGLPMLNNGTNGSLVDGCIYEKGEGDDEERLSLDEGHMGSLGPSPLVTRYDPSSSTSQASQMLSNYPHLIAQDPRSGGPQSLRWLDASGLGVNTGKHNAAASDSANRRDSKSTCGMTDAEDAESEFSLSAFRRDDIRLPSYALGSITGPTNGSRSALKSGHLRQLNAQDNTRASIRGSSELGTDIRSNDGTCDESDTSSLPEAGCDLVQLAQLDVSGRPNPLLNDLARQQANSRRWGQHGPVGSSGSTQPVQPNYEGPDMGRLISPPYMGSEDMITSPMGSHGPTSPIDAHMTNQSERCA
ncbi:28S ribosomal protein S5 mitochondrial [Fasciola gigantica]|uniref:28S ribosomal protein S5 mitochondrial n=1 Tax=Fasciola gigantica TaxID=46835 RepID=A0A504YJZ2_FASGI|nr:28S ribosomal protein S5 mitochondrial [Fasciola gigantica]